MVLLVAAAGVASSALLRGNPVPPPVFPRVNSAIVSSASGLTLELSLNSSAVKPGHEVRVTVEELNALPVANSVPFSTNWPLKGLGVGPCGPLNVPIGIVVFQGYFTAPDISTAQHLGLYEPGTYNCPGIFSQIDSYAFQPKSDAAAVYASGGSTPVFTANMSATVDAKGYWSSNLLQGAAFSSFPPGVYTVAGGDEWGAMVILHFVVGQSGQGAVNGLLLRVVEDGSGQPATGVTVVAGPASSRDDLVLTPGGPALKECVHEVGNGSTVLANGTVVFSNGTDTTYSACPVETYTTNSTGWISVPDVAGQYYFLRVGNYAFGIVELSQNGATYVMVKVPSGSYTVTP